MALVEVRAADGIVDVVLNRPDARNALSTELCDAIVDALNGVVDDPAARVVVLSGEGRVFCSGADFSAVSGPEAVDFLGSFERMLEAVVRFRLPTVASIHGAALGGGLQLASVCDFRVCTDDSKLGIPSSRLGILVNFENVQRLVLLVGVAAAKEILMTGRTLGGREAQGIGLVHRSVEGEAVARGAAADLARTIANNAPLSVQGTKRAIQVVLDHLAGARSSAPAAAAEIDRLVMEAYNSSDLAEGLRAMAEKREPRFKGD